ncbi:hypothetical protein RchiOBHm_Chr6g0287471 [Rosa chinensis]|uniref:Uncharacterized protein n=1 Tax=Rosa chinensis TaxID=74649 RepID=A0A2P6PV37_ROSCH|nr:hypothetical protein RchiOBHm_Chr6g0287471 [Rosa chinensis]
MRLDGKSLHISFSSVVSMDICCLYPLMWSTGSVVPSYFWKTGVVNRRGFVTFKMSLVNGDFPTSLAILVASSRGLVHLHRSIIFSIFSRHSSLHGRLWGPAPILPISFSVPLNLSIKVSPAPPAIVLVTGCGGHR